MRVAWGGGGGLLLPQIATAALLGACLFQGHTPTTAWPKQQRDTLCRPFRGQKCFDASKVHDSEPFEGDLHLMWIVYHRAQGLQSTRCYPSVVLCMTTVCKWMCGDTNSSGGKKGGRIAERVQQTRARGQREALHAATAVLSGSRVQRAAMPLCPANWHFDCHTFVCCSATIRVKSNPVLI